VTIVLEALAAIGLIRVNGKHFRKTNFKLLELVGLEMDLPVIMVKKVL
jgi:hypothetical protein